MPTFSYKCKKCSETKEVFLKIDENPTITCTECGEVMGRGISRNVEVVFKGTGWSGKNIKEKKYRLDRSKSIGKKMAHSYDLPEVTPNYKGEVCDSWEEAKQLAKRDGIPEQRYNQQLQNLAAQQQAVKNKVERLKKGE